MMVAPSSGRSTRFMVTIVMLIGGERVICSDLIVSKCSEATWWCLEDWPWCMLTFYELNRWLIPYNIHKVYQWLSSFGYDWQKCLQETLVVGIWLYIGIQRLEAALFTPCWRQPKLHEGLIFDQQKTFMSWKNDTFQRLARASKDWTLSSLFLTMVVDLSLKTQARKAKSDLIWLRIT